MFSQCRFTAPCVRTAFAATSHWSASSPAISARRMMRSSSGEFVPASPLAYHLPGPVQPFAQGHVRFDPLPLAGLVHEGSDQAHVSHLVDKCLPISLHPPCSPSGEHPPPVPRPGVRELGTRAGVVPDGCSRVFPSCCGADAHSRWPVAASVVVPGPARCRDPCRLARKAAGPDPSLAPASQWWPAMNRADRIARHYTLAQIYRAPASRTHLRQLPLR